MNARSKKVARAIRRCHWTKTELAIAYHDREWGVPVHDDRTFFEFGSLLVTVWTVAFRDNAPDPQP